MALPEAIPGYILNHYDDRIPDGLLVVVSPRHVTMPLDGVPDLRGRLQSYYSKRRTIR